MSNKIIGSGDDNQEPAKKILRATHEGSVEIAPGFMVKCFVLEDGRSVIMRKDILGVVGRKSTGGVQNRETHKLGNIGLPKNLKSFIPNDFEERTNLIRFIPKGRTANRAHGYDAQVLVDICKIYSSAYIAGALRGNQLHIGRQATAIVFALAGTAIQALIHEKTGYQKVRSETALQDIFLQLIDEKPRAYKKAFPDEFYRHACRLWGKPYRDDKKHGPWLAKITSMFIYDVLPTKMTSQIRSWNPYKQPGSGRRRARYNHQHFSEEAGISFLQKHIWKVIGLMSGTTDKQVFIETFRRSFFGHPGQQELIPGFWRHDLPPAT